MNDNTTVLNARQKRLVYDLVNKVVEKTTGDLSNVLSLIDDEPFAVHTHIMIGVIAGLLSSISSSLLVVSGKAPDDLAGKRIISQTIIERLAEVLALPIEDIKRNAEKAKRDMGQ